eukprot:TRINITY_DN4139_c0_g1_i1.p1 TRINITY_DN4139_c0_g1~~TRINITY_DN4139_c0_g1_i1.p1  ORF type:complete len:222 (-),score=29.83 TRINITY_DN4139_c0_g1_i1:55-690(-)
MSEATAEKLPLLTKKVKPPDKPVSSRNLLSSDAAEDKDLKRIFFTVSNQWESYVVLVDLNKTNLLDYIYSTLDIETTGSGISDKAAIYWEEGPELTVNTLQFVRDNDKFVVFMKDEDIAAFQYVNMIGMAYEDHQKKQRKFQQSWRWFLVVFIVMFYFTIGIAAFGPWATGDLYGQVSWYGTMTSALLPLFVVIYLWKGWFKIQLHKCCQC